MGIESNLDITEKLMACPFDHVCHLPKHHFLYKIPECKEIIYSPVVISLFGNK